MIKYTNGTIYRVAKYKFNKCYFCGIKLSKHKEYKGSVFSREDYMKGAKILYCEVLE